MDAGLEGRPQRLQPPEDVTDMVKQPRGENGQYVSVGTLFERERNEHSKDHEMERVVAKETAQRLEREVEQTAQRLERVVEVTALRIEEAVATALRAAAATAQVHADAHQKEHVAHERIHTVEATQVAKADVLRDRDALSLAEQLREFKSASNEWRSTVADQNSRFVTRELYDTAVEKLNNIEKRMAYYAGAAAVAGAAVAVILRLAAT